MSSSHSRSYRQPVPNTILPPIGTLLDAADMYHRDNERQKRYPPTPPGAGYPQTYDHHIQLPPVTSHHPGRGWNDPAYPTPPNSARSDRVAHPVPVQQPSAGASSRRHVCTQCGQAFDRPSSLQTHMHTHTGEQPYECTYPGCGRRFSVRSNMRRHMSVHEQPRMTDADAEDNHDHNPRHGGSGEYGVFSVAKR